jgi:glycine cleavage system H protein
MTRKFTPEHEWIEVEGDTATIGITHYAQTALGDVVFVDLPPVGKSVNAKQETAVVESVKAASDVYAPVSGSITEVNAALTADPGLVNRDPEKSAWFFKLKLSKPEELAGLLDEDAYKAHIQALS